MKDSYFSRVPKIRTQAEMQQTLEARSGKSYGGSVEPLGATGRTVDPNVLDSPKPSTTPAALIWDDPMRHGDDSGYQLSICGRWSVVKERLGPQQFTYRVFSRLPLPEVVGKADTASEARSVAQGLQDSGGTQP